jgi:Protein of unknown function (DUF1579)
MRSSLRWVAPLAVAAGLGLTSLAAAQQAGGQAKMSPEEQAMMAKWMEFATPGEHHKLLAQRVGTWHMKVSQWMAPDAPPVTSEGTSVCTSILDGRYFEDVSTGTFQGMPFHGRGLTGYDNLKKKYLSIWVDNLGTGIMVSEGDYDPKTKSFTFVGSGPDPIAGTYKPMKSVETWVSADESRMEMFGPGPDGKGWSKMMEIVYTRTK